MATHPSVLAWRIPGTGEPGWAAICGVAQSRTRLKWLSNSSRTERINVFSLSLPICGILLQLTKPLMQNTYKELPYPNETSVPVSSVEKLSVLARVSRLDFCELLVQKLHAQDWTNDKTSSKVLFPWLVQSIGYELGPCLLVNLTSSIEFYTSHLWGMQNTL